MVGGSKRKRGRPAKLMSKIMFEMNEEVNKRIETNTVEGNGDVGVDEEAEHTWHVGKVIGL